MSKVVDERVVEMQFDNRQFERNVAHTMSTLDKFKEKLNFSGAHKGLETIGTAAKNVDMNGLGAGVEAVRVKFSALQIAGTTALVNLANTAYRTGVRMTKALTIDPVASGFREYETQMNAVQTILANTKSKGSTLDDVNGALKELNTYADKTIYNFTEMTRNIGTFTAAGVDLETSVNAIQGIANLAAVSGSTSQQASTAMYQLSQALASGTVKLMDWNSVVNAGMGGEVFQTALKETSRLLGTGVDAAIKAEGSFRESLRTGWLTAEVLTETLKKFTTSGANEYVAEYTGFSLDAVQSAYELAKAEHGEAKAIEYAAKALAAKSGKNEEEIKSALELARTAEDAATKVKTFTQLWDVMKEAAQSGWAQTWQLIVGDFEEAKNLLTPLGELFTGEDGIITQISNVRNAILGSALGKTFSSISKSLDVILGPVDKVGDAFNTAVGAVEDLGEIVDKTILGRFGNGATRMEKLTEAGQNFYKVQNKVNEKLGNSFRYSEKQIAAQDELLKSQGKLVKGTAEETKVTDKLTKDKKELLKELIPLAEKQGEIEGYTEEQIRAFKDLGETARKLGMPLNDFIDNLDQINGRWLLINSFKNVGAAIIDVANAIGSAWKNIFPSTIEDRAESLFNVFAGFHRVTAWLKQTVGDNVDEIARTFKGLFAALDIVATLVSGPLKLGFKILSQILGAFDLSIWDLTAIIGDAIVKFRDWVDQVLDFSGAFDNIAPHITNAIDAIKEWMEGLKNTDNVGQYIIEGLINGIKAGIKAVINAVVDLAVGIWEAFCDFFEIHSPSKKMEWAGENIVYGFINGIINAIPKIFEAVKGFCGEVLQAFKDFDWGHISAGLWIASAFIPSAAILNILAAISNFAAVAGTTFIDKFKAILGINSPSKVFIAIGMFIVEGLIIGLMASKAGLFDKVDGFGSGFVESVKGWFAKLGPAISAGFVKICEMAKTGIHAVGKFLKNADWGSIIATGFAIGMLTLAHRLVSVFDKLISPFSGLGGIFENVGSLIQNFSKSLTRHFKAKSFDKVADGVLKMAYAIGVLTASVWVLSKIDEDDLWPAIGAIAALAGIVAGLALLSRFINQSATISFNAVSLVGMALSLLILAGVLKKLSQIELENIPQAIGLLISIATLMLVLMATFKWVSNAGSAASIAKVGGMLLGMSFAMLIMVGVIKLAGNLDLAEIKNGLAVVAALTALFSAIIVMSTFAGGHANKVGGMLLAMSFSMLIMIGIMKLASMLDKAEIIKGTKVILLIGGLFLAMIAVSNLAGKDAVRAGWMLLGASTSLLIMVQAMKQIAGLTESEIKKGLATIGLVGLVFVALVGVSKYAGQHAHAAGVMLLSMSGALLILTGVMWVISKMPVEDLKRSLAVTSLLMIIMGGLIAASKGAANVKKSPFIGIAISVGILVGALYALTLIEADKLEVAVKALTTVMLAFGLLVASTKYAGNIKFTTLLQLTIITSLLGVFVAALTLIKNPGEVCKTVFALSVLLMAFTTSIKILSTSRSVYQTVERQLMPLLLVAFGLTAVVLALSMVKNVGTAIAMTGLLIVLMGSFIAAITYLGKATRVLPTVERQLYPMLAIVAGLALIVMGMSAVPNPDAAIKMTGALVVLLGAYTAVTYALGLIGKNKTAVANAVVGAEALGVVIGAISVAVIILGSLMGLLDSSMMEHIQSGLDNFVTMMTKIGPMLLAFVPITAALATMGKFLGPISAMSGTLSLGAVVGLVGAISYLIGALMGLLSDTDFDTIETGLDRFVVMMTKFGEAIGGFIGGILGGIAYGVLATIGSGLSLFMTNVQGFIDGCGGISEDVIAGAKNLAGAIAVIAAADLLASLVDLLDFGPSLPMLGFNLTSFMLAAHGFIIGASQIDQSTLDGVKGLAEAIVLITAANVLDGISRFFSFGSSSLSSFGSQLPILGEGLVGLSDALSEGSFDKTLVEDAADVLVKLASAAGDIPNSGGLLGAIVGNNDLGSWSQGLEDVGSGIASFMSSLDGITIDTALAQSAAEVIGTLAEASMNIPNTGGLLADLIGDNDLGTWAAQLPYLGLGINWFMRMLNGVTIDESTIKSAVMVITELARASNSIPNTGGLLADLVGDNDFATWAGGLGNVALGIKAFMANIKGVDLNDATVTSACKVISSLADVSKNIDGQADWTKVFVGDNSISAFSEHFGTLGTNLKKFVENLGTFTEAQVATVFQACSAIRAIAALADSDISGTVWVIDSFGSKLPTFGDNIKTFCASVPEESSITTAVTNINRVLDLINDICAVDTGLFTNFMNALNESGMQGVNKFIDAFTTDKSKTDLEAAAKEFADEAVDGIEGVKDDFKTAAETVVSKGVDGAKSIKNYNDFRGAGKYLGEGLVSGIKDKSDDVYRAGYALGQKAVQGEKDGQKSNSPSKATIQAGNWLGEGLIIGMGQMFSSVYKEGKSIGEEASSGIQSAISAINAYIDNDIDAQPTIRPVVDLTDVRTGMNTMDKMLGVGSNVGVNANISGIAMSMNSRSQNGNNSDIISAIDKLRQDLSGMDRNTYTINGITYSEGTEVSDAVKALVRGARLERRV